MRQQSLGSQGTALKDGFRTYPFHDVLFALGKDSLRLGWYDLSGKKALSGDDTLADLLVRGVNQNTPYVTQRLPHLEVVIVFLFAPLAAISPNEFAHLLNALAAHYGTAKIGSFQFGVSFKCCDESSQGDKAFVALLLV
jgi:hypothetical protein